MPVKSGGSYIPLSSIQNDRLTKIAFDYWSSTNSGQHKAFDRGLVEDIYQTEILGSSYNQRRINMLEFSQYLEAYIWPNYTSDLSTTAYVLSILVMVNEKFRERISAWQCFIDRPDSFPYFFNKVMVLAIDENLSFLEQTAIITFLDNCFNSIEVEIVRQEVVKLCSLPIWINLLPNRRNTVLDTNQKLKKYWTKLEKKIEKMSSEEKESFMFNQGFLWQLLQRFKRIVDFIDDESKELDINAVSYCERLLLLIIDLEAQLTTRRFFNELLLSTHLITHCLLSQFIKTEHGTLFCELVTILKFYARFEINDINGMQLTMAEVTQKHYDYVTGLQKAIFKFFRDSVADFSMTSVGQVDNSKFLRQHLSSLSTDDLYKIAEYLQLVPTEDEANVPNNYARFDDPNYLIESIVFYTERCPSQLQRLNSEPLYPSEKVIWDEKIVPYEHYDGQNVLPLNKLNLQFLTLHDYLLRNFNLFRMESTYEIRQDLEDALFRMKPWKHEMNEGEVVWGGWAKMALPVTGCRIIQVKKPLVGETAPAEVKADIQLNLPKRLDLRSEWENVRKNDVFFLIKVKSTHAIGHKFDVRKPFKTQFDIEVVRGCEVEGILGPEGNILDEMENRDVVRKMPGDSRTYRVKFDPNQYKIDSDNGQETEIYFSFNLIIRRDPKTNNFKSVLATIRQLLNTEFVVPEWLHDLILGYGEPDIAHYSRINGAISTVDFNDTFLTLEHLKHSFPNRNVICNEENPSPPFRVTFKEFLPQHEIEDQSQRDTSIVVENQKKFNRVLTEEIHRNKIEFTPAQVEAIKSGMQPGLTIVVGPPGTGKTDVAVQILNNIYHNWPEQRTLIVTHSNQALNQLFEKIICLDVDERHLLRMGHGEESLETEKDFSRYGRVNYVLNERKVLLEQVEMLREALSEIGDVSYSCETAGYFFRYTVSKTWENFLENLEKISQMDGANPAVFIQTQFPFTKYFELRGSPLYFKDENVDENLEIANDAWERIQKIFKKLEEFRAFELLRNGRDRADYLLVKEAKIIAMTCTHAALRRKDLVELGFRYDNILMEEAAQILEVETFIPLLLQDPHDGRYRLKRWIMIGDHHQLPPVVQNIAYQKFSNMEQSLFTRFIRLGVPHVELDAQGRARSEIATLYNWRYKNLGDLPHVQALTEYQLCNPGFVHNFQLIDIPDFGGVGESSPSPHFYQNLGEAEYAIALYVYMRVLGYPAEKISIITTYNGQASLLRDIVRRRCAENPLIGEPQKISTVDKYQGQQNNYVILSLVRTKFVGHIRDIRRLVVALSRARLGLFILGRVSLFRNCFELTPAFNRLLQRPVRLRLLPCESFSSEHQRTPNDPLPMQPVEIVDTPHISKFVAEFYKSNLELLKQRYMGQKGGDAVDLETPTQSDPVDVQMVEVEETSTEQTTTNEQQNLPKEREEGSIVFEQIDFERLQEIPKY